MLTISRRPPRAPHSAQILGNPARSNMSASPSPSISFKARWAEVALFAAIFSMLALFVTWYVRQERFIYFWDYVGYHEYFANLGLAFEQDMLRALRFVFLSVRVNDYNLLPTLFLVPFSLTFGPGRLSYILSLTVTFAFPSIVLFAYVVRRLSGRSPAESPFDEIGLTVLSASTLAFLPVLWVPVVFGSVDVGGFLIILIVLVLYFRADIVDQSYVSLGSMALLLCLLVLYRRWYAYWVVGFFGALAVCEGLRFAADKARRAHWLLIARNALILGAISFLSFFLIATPIAKRMLTTDYGDIYSAYRSSDPFIHNLGELYQHFGLLTLVLAGLGIVLSVMNEKRRPIAYFLCVQFAITFVLFTRTQDFVISSHGEYVGVQHFYWALATLGLFLVFSVQDLFLLARSRPRKAALVLVILAGSLANFGVTFLPRAERPLKAVEFVLPGAREYPMVRTDLDQVQALLDALSDITKGSPSTVYVLASSFSLNSSIVQEGCFSLQRTHRELARRIALTNDVDKRDGFPVQFLTARYVVLTLPFAYHLPPQDQKVIGVLADQLVKGEGIGKSYDKLNYEFRLEDGSSAFIYKKTRPLDPNDLKSLSDQFIEFYPNNRAEFELSPDLIRKVSAL
jgi:hypothetical protein